MRLSKKGCEIITRQVYEALYEIAYDYLPQWVQEILPVYLHDDKKVVLEGNDFEDGVVLSCKEAEIAINAIRRNTDCTIHERELLRHLEERLGRSEG